MSARLAIPFALAVLAAGTAAHAQDATPTEPVEILNQAAADQDVFKFDFAVPSSPGLTLLGIDKDKITQSNSLKPFVLSLPTVLSSKEGGQAIALDIAPAAFLFDEEDRTYKRYLEEPGRALLFRTRTQLAVYEGVTDTDPAKQKASRLAIGISTSFLNSSDPLLSRLPGMDEPAWTTCQDSARARIQAAMGAPATFEGKDDLEDRIDALSNDVEKLEDALALVVGNPTLAQGLQAEIDRKKEDYRKLEAEHKSKMAAANAERQKAFAKSAAAEMIPVCVRVADTMARLGADLDFGAGAVWEGAPGEVSDFHDPSAVVWASFRTSIGVRGPRGNRFEDLRAWQEGLDQWFMVGLSTRIGLDEPVATGDTTSPYIRANTYTLWLGLERYTPDSRLAFQIGQQATDPRDSVNDKFEGSRTRYLLSYDQKLNDQGMWLNLSYGEAGGEGSLKDDKTVKLSLTFSSPDPPKIFGDQ